MTDYALVVRTEDGTEHISNAIAGVSTYEQAKELVHVATDQDAPVEWLAFDAGGRHVAVPMDTVTYLAVAPDLRGEEDEPVAREDGRELITTSFTIAAGAILTTDYLISLCLDAITETAAIDVALRSVTIDLDDEHTYTVTGTALARRPS